MNVCKLADGSYEIRDDAGQLVATLSADATPADMTAALASAGAGGQVVAVRMQMQQGAAGEPIDAPTFAHVKSGKVRFGSLLRLFRGKTTALEANRSKGGDQCS